jgi:hypothetical protein
MLRGGTTEDENRQTIPLLGGARAVRPWGGWWNRNKPTPALRATPPTEGIFKGIAQVSCRVCDHISGMDDGDD